MLTPTGLKVAKISLFRSPKLQVSQVPNTENLSQQDSLSLTQLPPEQEEGAGVSCTCKQFNSSFPNHKDTSAVVFLLPPHESLYYFSQQVFVL